MGEWSASIGRMGQVYGVRTPAMGTETEAQEYQRPRGKNVIWNFDAARTCKSIRCDDPMRPLASGLVVRRKASGGGM